MQMELIVEFQTEKVRLLDGFFCGNEGKLSLLNWRNKALVFIGFQVIFQFTLMHQHTGSLCCSEAPVVNNPSLSVWALSPHTCIPSQ